MRAQLPLTRHDARTTRLAMPRIRSRSREVQNMIFTTWCVRLHCCVFLHMMNSTRGASGRTPELESYRARLSSHASGQWPNSPGASGHRVRSTQHRCPLPRVWYQTHPVPIELASDQAREPLLFSFLHPLCKSVNSTKFYHLCNAYAKS
jgi:hypothetical protein